jgi:hypothetical protein
MALEAAAADVTSAIAGGCLGAAVVGGVTCLAGALMGLLVGGVFAGIEYWEYRRAVQEFEHNAFEKCREASHV